MLQRIGRGGIAGDLIGFSGLGGILTTNVGWHWQGAYLTRSTIYGDDACDGTCQVSGCQILVYEGGSVAYTHDLYVGGTTASSHQVAESLHIRSLPLGTCWIHHADSTSELSCNLYDLQLFG